MKIFSLIVMLCWSSVWGTEKNVCVIGPGWHIKAALYMNDQLILYTSDNQVYHIPDFKYEDGNPGFKEVKNTTLLSNWIQKIRYIFRYKDFVISVIYEKVRHYHLL